MKLLLIISFILASFFSVSQSRYVRAEQLYMEALANYREKVLFEAQELIEESLYLNPTAESNYLSGLIYEALGKDLKALAAYEATLQYDPDYKEAIFQKALIYLKISDPKKALEDINFLLENKGATVTRGVYFQVDPTGNTQNKILTLENLNGQLYYYKGQAFEKLVEYDKALMNYNEAIKTEEVPDYYISRALLQSKLGNDSSAVLDLKAALKKEPTNQLAWYNLALLDPTVELPDSLLYVSSFSPTLNLLGSRALEKGNYKKAKEYFDYYLENNDHDALAYINRGRVLLKCEKYQKAREDFDKAMKLDRSRSESLYLTGNAFFFEKEYQSALAYYNQYLAIDPTNAMVWYNGAMSYLELGNKNEACHFLKNADKFAMPNAKRMISRHCE